MANATCWIAIACFAIGCGGGDDTTTEAPPPPPPDAPCGPGEMPLQDGGCRAAGVQADGCIAGELRVDGACRPAGVPPQWCAPGFESDGAGGCEPVLPAAPCGFGEMAVPGDPTCRAVASCGSGPWGDIAVDAATVFVDASYAGGDGDGTEAKPFTTLGAGVNAAPAGGLVAVAAGAYSADLLLDSPVRVHGRCPDLVEIVGGGPYAAFSIGPGSDGTEIAGVAIRGAGHGVLVSAALDVRLDRLWIHDTLKAGVGLSDELGSPDVSLRDSLVEVVTLAGVIVGGGNVTVHRSTIRDVAPSSDGTVSRGVHVQSGDSSAGTGDIAGSLVEGPLDVGISAAEAHVTVYGSVVRGLQDRSDDPVAGAAIIASGPGDDALVSVDSSVVFGSEGRGLALHGARGVVRGSVVRGDTGFGIGILAQDLDGVRANLEVGASLVEGCAGSAILVVGADATLTSTLVRDTQADETGIWGHGIAVQLRVQSGQRGAAHIAGSVIESSTEVGVVIATADVVMEGCVVRDTRPRPLDQWAGRGINVQSTAQGASDATILSSIVEGNHDAGIVFIGSTGTIEGSVVRGTDPNPVTGEFGRGLGVQSDEVELSSNVVVRGSLFERNHESNVTVFSSNATIESSILADALPWAADQTYGDGLAVVGYGGATVSLAGSLVRRSARAGVSNFGALVSIADTTFDCNPLHIGAELLDGAPFELRDEGGNVCGCDGDTLPCQVMSSQLSPPDALDGP